MYFEIIWSTSFFNKTEIWIIVNTIKIVKVYWGLSMCKAAGDHILGMILSDPSEVPSPGEEGIIPSKLKKLRN